MKKIKIAMLPHCDFVTPPENMGQIVTKSYVWIEGEGEGYIVERIHDSSDNTTDYEIYYATDGMFEPWNMAPELGEPAPVALI